VHQWELPHNGFAIGVEALACSYGKRNHPRQISGAKKVLAHCSGIADRGNGFNEDLKIVKILTEKLFEKLPCMVKMQALGGCLPISFTSNCYCKRDWSGT